MNPEDYKELLDMAYYEDDIDLIVDQEMLDEWELEDE